MVVRGLEKVELLLYVKHLKTLLLIKTSKKKFQDYIIILNLNIYRLAQLFLHFYHMMLVIIKPQEFTNLIRQQSF